MSKSKKKEIQVYSDIVEPIGDIPFSSTKKLRQHVIKHCLENSGQRWQEFFTKDKLNAALNEYYLNKPQSTALHELIEMYRSLISGIVLELCREGKQHLHFVEERKIKSFKLFSQVVEAVDCERNIKIIAKAFVRNGRFQPYVLCTAYRNFSGFTNEGFRKEVEKRRNEKSFIKNNPKNLYGTSMTLIADHSGYER
jgi:hypothetical protein